MKKRHLDRDVIAVTKQETADVCCGTKWKFALMALVCFAALISGGSPAYGRPLSESNDPPRPGSHQPPQAYAANFCLSPFRTNTDGVNGGGSGPMTFSLQQQPFSAPPVRLRDDDPEYNKKSPAVGGGSQGRLNECFCLGGRSVCFQLSLFAHRTSDLEKQLQNGLGMGYGQVRDEFLLSSLFRGGFFQFRPGERIWLLRIRAFCLFGQFDVGVFRGNDAAGV